jgi:DNA (cytosine-5)-methyltransferase 1
VNELSLFTGAGGGLLGTMLLGFRPIGYVEWDDHCQRVIAARIHDGILPDAPIFGDIKTFISDGYAASYTGLVDVITGGFPCQDISCVRGGQQKGLEGERSGLWKAMAQVIRIVGPSYVLVENSPMLTLRGHGTVLRDLAEMGFDARWGVLSAASVGAPHLRERIWIVAHSNKKRLDAVFKDHNGIEGRGETTTVRGENRVFFEMGQEGDSVPTGQWPIPPEPERMVDGVADQLDRLKAIGNGQVPRVVATAWKILTGGTHDDPKG